tara:strand:+ start:58 stop:213 length:156 start_codon:yes stop_codon:yes gene_type:complete
MNEYKGLLEEDSIRNKPYIEIAHLHLEDELSHKSKWYKGSRYRGLRGDLAA